ncbi:MAG: Lcl domain-containing protein, partial [Methylophagaceae bacterium]
MQLNKSAANSLSVTCNGGNDGRTYVTAAGGTTPYSYLWDDANAQATDTAYNLSAGDYIATVIDASGCTATDIATISEPAIITEIDLQTACDTYTWSNGITYTADNNTASQTLQAINGCDSVVTVNLTINSSPTINLGADTTLICAGTSETIDAGTGFASYLWSDGSTSQTLSANLAGTYTVTGTDANGCSASDSMVIDVLTVDITQNDTAICEGDSLVLLAGTNQLTIGDNYQGGIVFYLDGNGGGLIAASSDQRDLSQPRAQWGCDGTSISGADGTGIGSGNQNTIDILNGCSTTGTAADICANLTLGGFSDWFLPSRDEINLIWQNLADSDGNGVNTGQSDPNNIGGFDNSYYWSSTESDNNNAWVQSFINGSWGGGNSKASSHKVRAVRAFTSNSNSLNYTYTWSPGGETTSSITVQPSATTTYTVDVTSGTTTCQSDVTITVNQRDLVTIDSTVCDIILWAGNSLTTSGTYYDSLQNIAGCDSIV